MQRVLVRLAVHRNRADAQLLARADHAQRNLTPICNQYLTKHECLNLPLLPKPHDQGAPCLAFETWEKETAFQNETGPLTPYFALTENPGWPSPTGRPLPAMRSTIPPAASASISFISFMASTMHSTC